MEKLVFGGAMLSALLVFGTFVVSLCIFLWKWFLDDFKRGYKDAMESD